MGVNIFKHVVICVVKKTGMIFCRSKLIVASLTVVKDWAGFYLYYIITSANSIAVFKISESIWLFKCNNFVDTFKIFFSLSIVNSYY